MGARRDGSGRRTPLLRDAAHGHDADVSDAGWCDSAVLAVVVSRTGRQRPLTVRGPWVPPQDGRGHAVARPNSGDVTGSRPAPLSRHRQTNIVARLWPLTHGSNSAPLAALSPERHLRIGDPDPQHV